MRDTTRGGIQIPTESTVGSSFHLSCASAETGDVIARQATSWVSLYGHRQQKELVGQIYFPFDGDELDKDDIEKLDSLVDKYIIALLGTRIRLRFEGHCDFRGDARYNRGLALRRAKAVQANFDRKLRSSFKYFSSSVISFGERFAGRKDIDFDRRVDIISSFVPRRPPIELPEVHIHGKIPKKFVRRPVQFLDIEMHRLMSADGPHGSIPPTHVIILEKYSMIEDSRSFPYNARIQNTKVHSALPTIQVHRYTIDWRRPQTSDTMKKASEIVLNILAAAGDVGGGFDFGEGVPAIKPPNIVYKSWSDFEARMKESDRDYLIYKGKSFSN